MPAKKEPAKPRTPRAKTVASEPPTEPPHHSRSKPPTEPPARSGGSLVEIVAEGGLRQFVCPLTGTPVWDDDGFDETAGQSPYFLFFVDWAGFVWVAAPPHRVPEWSGVTAEIVRIWRDLEGGNQNERIDLCVEALPRSGVVFEVLDPPYGPKPGSICYVGFLLEPMDPLEEEDWVPRAPIPCPRDDAQK